MPAPGFSFAGEALWLEFVNTAAPPFQSTELLTDAAALERWLRAAGLPSVERTRALVEARALRDLLLSLASALAEGRRPPTAAVAALNAQLRDTPGREQLIRVSGMWRLEFQPAAPDRAFAALARSAAITLTDPMVRVRRCAGPECGRYFLDTTQDLSRYWCQDDPCRRSAPIDRRRGGRVIPAV
jgi:predicted RNA-binding Zn ribbon-like protein